MTYPSWSLSHVIGFHSFTHAGKAQAMRDEPTLGEVARPGWPQRQGKVVGIRLGSRRVGAWFMGRRYCRRHALAWRLAAWCSAMGRQRGGASGMVGRRCCAEMGSGEELGQRMIG